MSGYDYDLFTIGAGSGGVRAARLAGARGLRSGLAEEWTVGGTCVQRGCVPKKFYVFASHFADDFEDAAAYGWKIEDAFFDWPTLVAAKKKELKRLEGIYDGVLDKAGVDLYQGRAVLEDAHSVRIGEKLLRAENIIIATGARPFVPDIPGAEHFITSNEIFDLETFPERLVINGAGYIALEFACIFAGLGADVSVVYRRDMPLRGFDEDVRKAVQREMETRGVKFIFNTNITGLEKAGEGITVALDNGAALGADAVLAATGRVPNTEGLGLEAAGMKLAANGAIVVDEYSQSPVPHIHAIGDCTDRVNLTPVAIHEAVCLIDTLYGGTRRAPDHETIPTAVFTQPPVGTVGLNEDQAREKFAEVDIYRAEFRPLKHTITGREEKVMMKIIVDPKTDRVLGIHMVGMDAGEIIQALGVAVKAGLTKAQLDATMAVHPTTAEELVLMYEKIS